MTLPAGFDYSLMDRELTIAEWTRRGVTAATPRPAGVSRPGASMSDTQAATLLLPAGANGPAFLATGNFRSILKYNNATSYALAVGHLADRLAGGGAFVRSWPVTERALRRREREELQTLLMTYGHYRGEIDGLFGYETKAALLAWQRQMGMTPDAFASDRMLSLLKSPVFLNNGLP